MRILITAGLQEIRMAMNGHQITATATPVVILQKIAVAMKGGPRPPGIKMSTTQTRTAIMRDEDLKPMVPEKLRSVDLQGMLLFSAYDTDSRANSRRTEV